MAIKIVQNNEVVNIEQVKPNDYNPKKHYTLTDEGQRNFADLKKRLEKAGQNLPVQVRELEDGTFEIINGFHRYEALKELGAKKIEIKNLGKLSRQEAIKEAISGEEIKIPIDKLEEALLFKELSEQESIELLAQELPFTVEEITDQIKLLDFDFEGLNTPNEPTPPNPLSATFTFDDARQKEEFMEFMKQVKAEGEGMSDGEILTMLSVEYAKAN